jgi:hypothetical protein
MNKKKLHLLMAIRHMAPPQRLRTLIYVLPWEKVESSSHKFHNLFRMSQESSLRVGDLVWVENDGQWAAGLVVQMEHSFVSVQVGDHEVSLPSNDVFSVCPEGMNSNLFA